jgi:hypothetical protein
MTGRAFIVMMAFVFSACATTTSSMPQFPKVKMEGNRLVDHDYGYSVQIPAGWKMIDESYIEKLDQNRRKEENQEFSNLISQGLRASFWEGSEKAKIFIWAMGPGPPKTPEEAMTLWRKAKQNFIKKRNDSLGVEHLYNLEFNRFKNLTSLNSSYESSKGYSFLNYLQVFSFKQSIYGIELGFTGSKGAFDSYLPLFYDCVNSLTVPGRSATPQEQEPSKTLNQRLEELKRLKDRNLITDEEYEQKKKKILDEL